MTAPTPSSRNAPHIPVVAAVIERDGTFLLAKRPPEKFLAGYWEFPGGKLEAGESPQQALVRELYEELGATVVIVGKNVGTARHDYERFTVEIDAYRVRCDIASLVPREHTELQWFAVPVLRTIRLAPADFF